MRWPRRETAPASTAPHSTKLAAAAGAVLEPAGAGPTVVMALLRWISAQAEKAEDEQDDDHQTDEIDDAVHGITSLGQSTQGLCGLKRPAENAEVTESFRQESKTAQ